MTELERYLFDLQGYLVVENALSSEQLASLNHILDTQVALHHQQTQPWSRFDRLLGWGEVFRELIDLPTLTPYLEALLGPKYRLDHDYVHLIRQPGPGPIGVFLHGGGTPFDPCQYYHVQQGKIYNGLTAVAFNLTDVAPKDGGFGCIPGSHKSHFPLPTDLQDLAQPHACIQEVTGKAGTAIIFTEALSHTTLHWRGNHERRTLFYKYSPHPSAWHRRYYDANALLDLTPSQRQILQVPGVAPD
jgi:ectoine hydroxylase-related dioxygenase (phytanoyl-CoA dioxygenase family)